MRLNKLREKKQSRPDRSQMERLKEQFGFVEQPGSGSGRWKKSDLFDTVHQVEGKATDKRWNKVTADQLTKITREADRVGKVPAFVIGVGGRVPAGVSQDWIAVPAAFYEELIRVWKNSSDKT